MPGDDMSNHKEILNDNTELISLLNTVLDIDSGIIVVNNKGIITFVNKTYADFFNKPPEHMVGKFVDDAYENSEPSKLPQVLATGKPTIGDVFYLNGRNVISNRFPLYKDGKIVGAVGKVIFKDIQEFQNVYAQVNRGSVSLKPDINKHSTIKYDINNIIGGSPQMIDLKEAVCKIAHRNSTVLIRGESGTGKELLAHSIHHASYRRNNSFIKVNCAAIPEHLLESELFGYVEGAFTGAKKGGLKGKFELADKGTIFLDEIGDMSFNMQAKLLRVLQEKEIVPLGGSQNKNIDVRIIAATNVNLEELIKYGKFRADLYYRLNVVGLYIPSLRERKEDLDLLVKFFIQKFNGLFDLDVKMVSPEVLRLFKKYNWPGNIRELENVMEQAFNFVEGNIISVEYIPGYITSSLNLEKQGHMTSADTETMKVTEDEGQGPPKQMFDKPSLVKMVDSAEKQMILEALLESKGNKAKAAKMLGLSRPGLYKKIAKYQIPN